MIILNRNTIQSHHKIGGKAEGLMKLCQMDLNVPHWVVIPSSAFDEIVGESSVDIIQKTIESYTFPNDFKSNVLKEFDHIDYFAVRSSALCEDSNLSAFAGQFKTALFVKPDGIEEAIKSVWLSAYSNHVLDYMKMQEHEHKISMAVVIQEMIVGESSGVAFNINPVDGNRNEKIINGVWGIGEGLVSGKLTADQFLISNNKIKKTITKKEHQFVCDFENSKTKTIEVEKNLQNIAIFNEAQIFEIVEKLDRIFTYTGKFSDIEFTYAHNQLFLLQARPITNLNNTPDTTAERIVWDNSNIIESYPNCTLPLTFSFIIDVYEKAYKQLLALFGVRKSTIEQNARVFSNMLGLLNGRVYYNLKSWYYVLSMLPGYKTNASFMEKMMGVKEKFELDNLPKKTSMGDKIDIVRMIFKLFKNLNSLNKQKKSFVELFEKEYAHFLKNKINALSIIELMLYYESIETGLLSKWKAPLVNDFFAMIFFGVLQKLTKKYLPEKNGLHNDLLTSSKNIISVKPAILLQEIIQCIRSDETFLLLFEKENLPKMEENLRKETFLELDIRIREYLYHFGNRCTGELKLETETYQTNPSRFYEFIHDVLSNSQSKNSPIKIELNLRSESEKIVQKAFRGRIFKRFIFNYVLKTARTLVADRENLRLYRTQAFSMARKIFTEIGKRLFSENLLDHPRDVFYLKKDEIFSFVRGTNPDINLKYLVDERKVQYEIFNRTNTLSDRVTSYGIAAKFLVNNHHDSVLEGDLKGIACSKGIVRKKVVVVHDPEKIVSLNGDILVTSTTDPGWINLFATTSGILVERGSLLSHSAIVSREMGIPCIVGINHLVESLKTGDLVEMDGSTGLIKIIDKQIIK